MKGFVLKSHEAQALAAGKPVVIWRVCKVQPVMHRWEHESANPPFHDAMGFVGKEICAPGYLAIGVDRAMDSAGYLRIPFPVGVPLFGKETWDGGEVDIIRYKADGGPAYNDNGRGAASWKPSVYMPKWASRITLTLSDVRVRRPCDVTGEEACDMLTEECRAKAPYMETKGVLADWHIRAFRKQFSLHYKTDWSLYHFVALATPQPKDS